MLIVNRTRTYHLGILLMSDFTLPQLKTASLKSTPYRNALKSQSYVIHALILHDIKSRFFGNGLGYIVSILWPTVHMIVLMVMFLVVGRAVPYGDSAALYAATGVLPYIAWNYISRFVSLGMTSNRSFMAYPVIKPLDMMFSRTILELVSIFIITIGTILILAACEVKVIPNDPGEAVLGLLSAVALGIGCGYLVSVFCLIHHFFNVVYVLFLILFWVTSGLAINPEALPDQIGQYLAWNPLLHCIEWVRKAYYLDFPAHLLDKSYVLEVAAGTFVLGLILERLLRKVTLR